MDTILQAFLSWQFLAFSLSIGAIIYVIRQVVEYAMIHWWPLKQWKAANKQSKVWRALILPILPILLGGASFFITTYPYPEGFNTSAGRLAFGLVAGFTSGMFVRLYNSFLASSIADFAQKIRTASEPPKPRRRSRDRDRDRDHDHDHDDCDHDHDSDLEQSVRDSIKKDQ